MAAYRKKPVVIQAVQNLGEWKPIIDWLDSLDPTGMAGVPFGTVPAITRNADGTLDIKTLEGTMLCRKGDYVIQGIKGEFYPCDPDIFKATYDAV